MRNFLLSALLLMGTLPSFSQVQLGFKVSPLISANRVNIEGSNPDVDNNGSALRVSFGPVADFNLTGEDKYFFTTGLWFTSKRAGISYSEIPLGGPRVDMKQSYNLQYLQIPAGLKLYTNEIGLDKRIFFQFGPTLDLKIDEKQDTGDRNTPVIKKFRPFDMDIFIGGGLDYRISESNRLFAGITYYRGLINAASDARNDDISYKNDLIAFEFGIMF